MQHEQLTPSSTAASKPLAFFTSPSRMLASLALGLAGLAASQAGFAQVAAVPCDGRLYISQGSGQDTTLNYSNGSLPLSFASQGTSSATYNALGMNPNGYLYAMNGASNQLLQINPTNGTATIVTNVTNLPAASYNSGTFSTDGTYYVKAFGSNSTIYAINIANATATAIPLVNAANAAFAFTTSDLAWASGGLYSVDDNEQLYSINTSTGLVTPIGSAGSSGSVFGAQFGFTNGLFGAYNNGSGFYQINLTTGARTLVSVAPAAASNDGANCPSAAFAAIVTTPTASVPVPTLGQWTLMLLAGLLGTMGMVGVRRRLP